MMGDIIAPTVDFGETREILNAEVSILLGEINNLIIERTDDIMIMNKCRLIVMQHSAVPEMNLYRRIDRNLISTVGDCY